MPQLDHVSYFSQFFWVSIFFLSFYVILVRSLLPRVATVLKLRKKLTLGSSNEISSPKFSSESNSYESVLSGSIKETNALLADVSRNSSEWVKSTTEKIASQNLGESNSKYLESIADILSKKYIIQSLLNK